MGFIKISLLSFLSAFLLLIALFALNWFEGKPSKVQYELKNENFQIDFAEEIPIKNINFEIESLLDSESFNEQSKKQIDRVIVNFQSKIDERISSLNNKNANFYLRDIYRNTKYSLSLDLSPHKKYYHLKVVQMVHKIGISDSKNSKVLAYAPATFE